MNALSYDAFIVRQRHADYTAKLLRQGDFHHLDHAARNAAGVVIQANFRALREALARLHGYDLPPAA